MTIRRRNNKAQLPYNTLEKRQMLTTFVVNTVDDIVSDTDGLTSLREAVQLANADDAPDVITFDASIADQPVLLETPLRFITTEITFDGDLDDDSVADITIAGVDGISSTTPGAFSSVFSVSQTTVQFDGLTFSGFTSDEGLRSVISIGAATVSIVNSNFDGSNITNSTGVQRTLSGGLYISASDVFIDNTSFTNNLSGEAGAIVVIGNASGVESSLTIKNSTFDNNTGNIGAGSTGAIASSSGSVSIDNSSFTNNSGGSTGALKVLDFIDSFDNPGVPSQLTISNSVFTGNEGDMVAGAIRTQSVNAEISNTLIADNIGGGNGGGITFANQLPGFGALSVSNSTISGNTAADSGGGVSGGGSFVNTTITGNVANRGGGVSPEFGALSLENSIVLGNYSTESFEIDDDIWLLANQPINVVGANILGPNSFPDSPGIVIADPTEVFAQTEANIGDAAIVAGVLADNGGPYQTVALLDDLNNPALDVGVSPSGVTTDAAGNPRSFDQLGLDNGGTVDAGALELQTQVDVSVAAVIGGDLTGTAMEDSATSGVLTISDANGGSEEVFVQDTIDATYGQLSIQTNGDWTYSPSNAITQSLREGQEVTETFTVSSVDGTTAEIVVTLIGVNDVATINRVPVEISEDATQPLTGQINVVDRDADESEIRPSTQTGLYGVFEIDAAGQWTYVLDNSAVDFLAEGADANDLFVLTSLDGTEAAFLVVVLGENDPAIIGGELSGETDADSTNPVSGSATVVELDAFSGEEGFQAAALTGSFGTLEIGANGSWTYLLDSDLTSDIPAGEEVVDQIAITSVDGTTATVSITITGTAVPEPNDPLVLGTDEDDTLLGSDGDDILVGGVGSDVLVGSLGDDIFFTDRINGDINRNDQDIIDLGNLDDNATGNDVIRDFDINHGNENNFDTLEFTFLDTVFSLSTGTDILDFIDFIESDGDRGTDAIQDGTDLIFVFDRDSEDPDIITQSIRFEDVIGGRSLTDADIAGSPVTQLGAFESDLFATDGEILVGNGSNGSLNGGDGDDFLVGGGGSDVLIGGAGDDVLTGDQTDGGSGRQDQDVFVFGNIDQQDIGNDVITDFDTNNFRGGESNFDTATLTFAGRDFSLATGREFLTLIRFLQRDGIDDTDAILDGDDILFVFSRDDNGRVTESIRFEDVVGDDGLTVGRLNNRFNNIGEITNETV